MIGIFNRKAYTLFMLTYLQIPPSYAEKLSLLAQKTGQDEERLLQDMFRETMEDIEDLVDAIQRRDDARKTSLSLDDMRRKYNLS